MGMKGSLHDLPIVDLFRLTCVDRQTVEIKIRHSFQHASIYFQNGKIVHAILGNQIGDEVIFQVLKWDDGFYTYENNYESPTISINRNWLEFLEKGSQLQTSTENEIDSTIIDKKIQIKNVQEEGQMAQSLNEILIELAGQVTGYIASALVGIDGINLASNPTAQVPQDVASAQITPGISGDNIDPELISTQMTMLMKLVDSSVEKIGAGILEYNLTSTEDAYVLMRFLPGKQSILVIAAFRKTGNLGNLRLVSKMYAERLEKAMPH